MRTSVQFCAEVLGDEEPEEAARRGGYGRVEPAFVDRVFGGVAGRVGHGQHDSALGAVGGRAGGRVDVASPEQCQVDDQGVADAAVHHGPDLALVGAHLDAHAPDAGIDDLEVALDGRVAVGVENDAAVGVEDHRGCLAGQHVDPVRARILAPPDAAGRAAQGGVDDHLAGGRELGIDDDLVGGVADEGPVALQRRGMFVSIGSGLPLESTLTELSSRVQVAPPSMEIRKPTPGVPRVPLAGGGDDDCLVHIVIPREDGDAADVDRVAGPEVGERDPGRAGGVGREEVGGLPDAAAGTGRIDGVARRVGRIDRQARDTARAVRRRSRLSRCGRARCWGWH